MAASSTLWFAAGVVTASCAAAALLALHTPPAVPPVPVPASPPAAPVAPPAAPAPAELAERLDRIETRLAEIAAGLRAARERSEVAEKAAGAARAEAGRALRAAAATPEGRWEGAPTEKVLAEVREMNRADRSGRTIDGPAVVRACDLLLARAMDPATRAEVLIQKGIGLRVQKDRAGEEAAFREALTLAGAGTETGRIAGIQLAWTEAYKGDHGRSGEAFLALTEDAGARESQRTWNLYYAGVQFDEAGDRDRARTIYARVVTACRDSRDSALESLGESARRNIDRMDAAK